MLIFFKSIYCMIINFGAILQSILLLAMRVYWGGSFFLTGWGKLHNISAISEYFSSLSIPFPTFNAYLVGTTECIGGFCLLLGLASRLVSIPLICVVSVALLTAHYEALMSAWDDPQNLITQLPFNYLLTTLIILAFGPGKISADFFIQKLFFSPSKSKDN